MPGGLFTGKVVLQGGEEVSDDRHAPGPPKQLLTGHAAHVGDVCVVYREAEDPGGGVSERKDRESDAPPSGCLAPLGDSWLWQPM